MGSDSVSDETAERRFRTLFISDVHLGARGSQADRLLDFLRSHDADTIYLVGDIVDGWALKSYWHWPQSHNDFVQKLLRKARKGAKVIYVPGNHDEFLRKYYGTHFGGIDVVENTIHTGADGKRARVAVELAAGDDERSGQGRVEHGERVVLLEPTDARLVMRPVPAPQRPVHQIAMRGPGHRFHPAEADEEGKSMNHPAGHVQAATRPISRST